MRIKGRRRWIIWIWRLSALNIVIADNSAASSSQHEPVDRQLFSPRMDYNQWKPLGRGDPLKNDPTYDYVPPVLDQVRYWIDPEQRKNLLHDPHKTEILLLGVSSKKPSIPTNEVIRKDASNNRFSPEHFFKFIDGPKFTPNQRFVMKSSPSNNYHPHHHHHHHPQPPHHSVPTHRYHNTNPYPSHYSSPPPSFQMLHHSNAYPSADTMHSNRKHMQSAMPFTHLMPPPAHEISTPATSLSSVTTPTNAITSVQASNLIYQLDDDGELDGSSGSLPHLQSPSPFSFSPLASLATSEPPPSVAELIKFSASGHHHLVAQNSDHINFVTPPPLKMHKGHVSDDNLEHYVKIGKSEVHSTGPDDEEIQTAKFPLPLHTQMPLTLHTLETMQTMQPPPPPPTAKRYTFMPTPLTDEPPTSYGSTDQWPTPTYTAATTTTTITETPTPAIQSSTTTAAAAALRSTTMQYSNFVTTHLIPEVKKRKKPSSAQHHHHHVIIQGHSKVKTYGPSKHIHGIAVVQNPNEIDSDLDEHTQADVAIKHLHLDDNAHKKSFKELNHKIRQGRSEDLQTLKHAVQAGVGRVSEADVQASYKVADMDATTETYHKGIVETVR